MIEFEHKSATDGPIIIIVPQSASKSKYWTRVAIFPNRMRKNARPNGSFETRYVSINANGIFVYMCSSTGSPHPSRIADLYDNRR